MIKNILLMIVSVAITINSFAADISAEKKAAIESLMSLSLDVNVEALIS